MDDVVAVSVYCGDDQSSRVVLFDASTGKPAKGKQGVLVELVPGNVTSIMHPGKTPTKPNWREELDPPEYSGRATPILLYVLTSTGEMFGLKEGTMTAKSTRETRKSHESDTVPRLPAKKGSASEPPKKRCRGVTNEVDQNQVTGGISNYGSIAPLQNSELPSLSGGFTRAFLCRNLSRAKHS